VEKKVFCKDCKHLEFDRYSTKNRYRCLPVKIERNTWKEVKVAYTYSRPDKKNKRNNCPDYEEIK